jgi:elongator complex protein 2
LIYPGFSVYYLFTDRVSSLDQTTRIHGPVLSPSKEHVWHEISRPQVHGYDLVGVQFLDALTFISISDEKVARIFEAPRTFVQRANTLQVANLDVDEVSWFKFPADSM